MSDIMRFMNMRTSETFNAGDYRDAMQAAINEATTSNDPSTQTGAVLVGSDGKIISRGSNNMPRGVVSTPERSERPLKYLVREHAERVAIYRAARVGRATIDSVMVSMWAACADCARATICAGCKAFVRFPLEHDASNWGESQRVADEMLTEAGVAIVEYDFPDLNVPRIRRSGDWWTPERVRSAN